MPALTARTALDALALPVGSTVLVTGAAGGVGRHAVALAHADRHRVEAIARASDEKNARALGADPFIDQTPDSIARVRASVPDGVDAVIDAAGMHQDALPAITRNGKLSTVQGWSGQPGAQMSVIPVNVRDRATDRAAIERLREQVEAGTLTMTVAQPYPAKKAEEAHRFVDAGHVRGRVILTW